MSALLTRRGEKRRQVKLHRQPIVAEDSDMTRHYLSKTEVAERLGVKPTSLDVRAMPAPDVTIGETKGWSEKTIEAWNAKRPGRGNWGPKKPARKP